MIGMDNEFHDFHIHGHRWRDPADTFTDTPTVRPKRDHHRTLHQDNPGHSLYHCHVFSHQDGGMAGWYLVSP